MEADWEVEIGKEAPVIHVLWAGFVDLRCSPERAGELAEAVQLPALAEVLVRLNEAASPVWTSKCDVWQVTEFDPDELDAPSESSIRAIACYIDLLCRDEQWLSPAEATEWCRTVCSRIRAVPLRCARVDLIVREAVVSAERTSLGVTAYLTACGPTDADAARVLGAAMAVLADSVLAAAPPATGASKLQ